MLASPNLLHGIPAKRWERPPGADALIAQLAERQHGVVARRQLLDLGLGRGAISERLAAGVEASRDGRALLLDALLAPGGVIGNLCDALEAAGPYGAGWPAPRVAAGPARLIKTGIVGDGHVRGLACGDDGKSFKWIAFRMAATDLGQALLSSPSDRRWWLAGTIKRDDGTEQVTLAGRPLYLYAGDSHPGDVTGQAVGGIWWAVSPSGAKITAAAASSSAPQPNTGY